MKIHKSRFLLILLLTALALVLSACQINFITDIKDNGSGLYSQEIGFQGDEASMAGMTAGDESFCAGQNSTNPPNTVVRQETRNGNETWCIYETAFETLDDLKSIYGLTDMTVNDVSTTDGKFTYDIALDMSSDSSATSAPTGSDVYWIVNMPGKITENNATEQSGNTLKWKLQVGQVNNIRAASETGGATLSGIDFGSISPYIYGGACLCMCGLALVVIAIVVFLVLRRNKKKAAESEPVIDTPAPLS